MRDNRQAEEQNFVEEVGLVFEQTGLPRMAGRILGRLLISDPPHQSTAQLTDTLLASKGSISTMTRHLIRMNLIERFSLPGVRHDYFRIKPGATHRLFKDSLSQTTSFRQLMERGLKLTEGKSPLTQQWLEEMHDMYSFFEREFPTLLSRWEQETKKRSTSQVR